MTLPAVFLCASIAIARLLGGLRGDRGLVSSHAAALPQEGSPNSASCTTECNRKAADCIDACEEKFKDDDKGRVTCKFECATKRQQCEKDCD